MSAKSLLFLFDSLEQTSPHRADAAHWSLTDPAEAKGALSARLKRSARTRRLYRCSPFEPESNNNGGGFSGNLKTAGGGNFLKSFAQEGPE